MILPVVLSLALSTVTSQSVSKCELGHDVKYFDVRLTRQHVPANRTFYVCQQVQVPLEDDGPYHMVAFEPIISNRDVMHHMLLFGCGSGTPTLDAHECVDRDSSMCPLWLTVWTLGQTGSTCLHGDAGVRFGKDSLQTLALQIHWNNAEQSDTMYDNSGFRIYYTSKLRPYDMGHVQIGQNDIEIPAKSIETRVTGSCSGTCTRKILQVAPVYLTMTSLHMHHMGARAHFGVYRKGTLIATVANDDNFAYSSSSIHEHRPAIEVTPGDEIKLDCWFTNHGNESVYWNKGSEGEMCYAFVSYYPEVPGFAQCVQFDNYDTCLPNASDPTQIGPCHASTFYKEVPGLLQDIVQTCSGVDGHSACDHECRESVVKLKSKECMQDRLGKYFERAVLKDMDNWSTVQEIITRLNKCFM